MKPYLPMQCIEAEYFKQVSYQNKNEVQFACSSSNRKCSLLSVVSTARHSTREGVCFIIDHQVSSQHLKYDVLQMMCFVFLLCIGVLYFFCDLRTGSISSSFCRLLSFRCCYRCTKNLSWKEFRALLFHRPSTERKNKKEQWIEKTRSW